MMMGFREWLHCVVLKNDREKYLAQRFMSTVETKFISRRTVEPPWRKIQNIMWGIKHKSITKYKPRQVRAAYYAILDLISDKSVTFATDEFMVRCIKVRIAGATIILNEKWSINDGDDGVYVHYRDTPDASWELVYKTNAIMGDLKFIDLLFEVKNQCLLALPANQKYHEKEK